MVYLIYNNLKGLIDKKRNILFIVSILILLIIGTFYSMKNNDNMVKVPTNSLGIIDHDNNKLSKMLIGYFKNNKTFNAYLNVIVGEEKDIIEQFNEGKILVYVEIPKGFVKNLIHLSNEPIKARINSKNTTQAIVIRNILESYEKYITAVEKNVVSFYDIMSISEVSEDTLYEANNDISIELVMSTLGREAYFDYHELTDVSTTPMPTYYLYAGISAVFLFLGVFIGISLIKDRDNGIVSRYLVSGNSMIKYIVAKIATIVLLIGIIIGVPYTLLSYLLGLHVKILSLLFVFLFLTFGMLIFIAISSVIKIEQNYLLISNAIATSMVIFGGGIIPIKFLPDSIKRLSELTPNYWFVKEMIKIQNQGINHHLIMVIVLMILIIILLLMFSSFSYRKVGVNHE